MKNNHIPLFLFLIYLSCTSNPIWNDSSTSGSIISGTVVPENRNGNVRVCIWLEDFNIITYTNEQDRFIININEGLKDVSGQRKIYFFIHNYLLDSIPVNFINGRLANNQLSLDENGELVNTIYMKKVLSCIANPNNQINESLELSSPYIGFNTIVHQNSSIDIYRFSFGDSTLYNSGLMIYNITNNDKVLHRYATIDNNGNPLQDYSFPLNVEIYDELVWNYLINIDELNLAQGEYLVAPYFQIKHSYLPIGLINALGGMEIFTFSNEYFNMPMDIVSANILID